MQRQPLTGSLPDVDLTESASPLMASAIGSVTLDGFATGKADISADNEDKLAHTAATIVKLLKKYPASKLHVTGYTDAVGQEADNATLGQSRADAVQAALRDLGIPDAVMQTESRGAANPVVKTSKGEARNRRVEVRFETSTLLRKGMSAGLTLGSPDQTSPAKGGGGLPGVGDLCKTDPKYCPGGQPGSGIFQPIPDNTPYSKMDLLGVGVPGERGDLTALWAQAYRKYLKLGFTEDQAAWLANKELSSTSSKEQSRSNPSPLDKSDEDMKKSFPNSTTVGPGSVTLFKF
jgi:hypothetical protein